MKLQGRILLPIMSLFVLILVASSYISYTAFSKSLRVSLLDNMHGQAAAVCRATAELVRSAMADVKRTAESDDVINFFKGDITDPDRVAAMNEYFKKLNDSYPNFGVMSVIDTKGILTASTDTV